jgi:hypothetical protein
MANIVTSSQTTSSISVYVDNLDTGYDHDDRYILWYINGTYTKTQVIDRKISYTPTITFYGLSAGTTYSIKAEIYYNYGNNSVTLTHSVTTDKPTRPSEFSWETAKTSGQTFKLTAKEWNDLTDNINDVRNYKNKTSYSFTTAVPGEPLTVGMYNEVVEAIKGMKSNAGIYEVEKGWVVYDWRLNDLVEELNSIS